MQIHCHSGFQRDGMALDQIREAAIERVSSTTRSSHGAAMMTDLLLAKLNAPSHTTDGSAPDESACFGGSSTGPMNSGSTW